MNRKILNWDKSPRQISALITPSTKLSESEEFAFARLYLEVGWEGVSIHPPSVDSRLTKGPGSVIVTLFHRKEDCANMRQVHTRATMLALETPAYRGAR